MNHINDIKGISRVLNASEKFNLLIVKGLPGRGKTSTVRDALCSLKIPFQILGSYSTPLALYHKVAKDPMQRLSKASNSSKGARSYLEWKGHSKHGPIPEDVRAWLVQVEKDARQSLTDAIARRLRG